MRPRLSFSIPEANLPPPVFLDLNYDNSRVSEVQGINLINISQAGVMQLGDRSESNAMLRALAIQRQKDHPYAGDIFFESYVIFSRPIPAIIEADDDDSVVQTYRLNQNPCISVGCISIISAGASSQIVIGRGQTHRSESRIKHIRQFAGQQPLPPICP
ncbi:spore germination protein GerPE [Paenibacillus sp. PR3]|uniref:Spore germination protein GerPE n=1 Tax=Paenibacillus terricola TaxID=2763503 RepID=A0ABR8MRP2_9BACL|nr:spore germination protein GerPE [Paenibacillus terricola]MBD3918656.1 spore germination protein GerPE [Paenibacillus terricola]